jgi:ubiquinone/menaquinone biosynthesis C-methylase UbiE
MRVQRRRYALGSVGEHGMDPVARRDIEFHKQAAASYDADVTEAYAVYHERSLHPYLDRLATAGASGPVLDLGCGTGVVAVALVERGFEVVGIDHSPQMLEVARRKLERSDPGRPWTLRLADARALPFADASFRGVTCQGVLHHLDTLRPCLAELERVLAPDGFFFISEPCRNAPLPKRLFASAVRRVRRSNAVPAVAEDERPIDARELRSILDELGLMYELEFMLLFNELRTLLPAQVYGPLVAALSRPWRRRGGDLVFVYGRKLT